MFSKIMRRKNKKKERKINTKFDRIKMMNKSLCKLSKNVEEENEELQRLHDFFIKSLDDAANKENHDPPLPPTFNSNG